MSDPKLPPELAGEWPLPVQNGAHRAAEAKVRAAKNPPVRPEQCSECKGPLGALFACPTCERSRAAPRINPCPLCGKPLDAYHACHPPLPGSIQRGRKCAMPDCEEPVTDRSRRFCKRCSP
jgi:hypothetical protein